MQMKIINKYLILFFLLVLFYVASAQNSLNYRFQYLLIEDGLPQNAIKAITKDSYGFMWFGTYNGICRFDGYSFETFQSDENQLNSLPDNMISSIEQDLDNRLWIGSLDGLSYFNLLNGEIFRFTDEGSNYDKINKVTSIVSQDSLLWVGTSNNGIFLLKSKSNGNYYISHQFTENNSNLTSQNINDIYLSNSNKIYIGSQKEALLFNPNNHSFEPFTNQFNYPANTNFVDIFESSKGDLYLSTSNGLLVHWKESSSNEFFRTNPANINAIVHQTVSKVDEDAKGDILVASLGGLQRFDTETKKFYSFPEEGPDNFKLNNQFINTLYCDNAGNVWIGTEKGGINKFNIYQNQFDFYTNDPNNSNSINENTINSILKEEQNLWIGTAGGGLNRLNLKSGKFIHYTYNAFNSRTINSDYITSLTRGDNGKLWVGSWGNGLNCLTTTNNNISIKRISSFTQGYKNELVNSFVSTLVHDDKGFLVIGTEGGLSSLNYKTKKFTTLLAPENTKPQLTEIGCIQHDSKGFYWIGTRNGLFRFPDSNIRKSLDNERIISQLQCFINNPKDSNSISGNYITSLLEDSKGNIWAGTYGKGVCLINVNANGTLTSTSYSEENGLSNNVVYGIQEDNSGNMWFSTDFGLSLLDIETQQFRNFYKQDGLLSNQFYWSASYKSDNGELFFGGIKGLNHFKPEEIIANQQYVTPKITKLKIFNDEVNPGDIFHEHVVIQNPIYISDTVNLTYRDNNISLDFSAFDYYLPDKTRFAYMMTDIDKDWIFVPSQRRFASYSNLTGGTYKFLLKAANCDGIWNETPTEVTIIVTPPFWKTKWFTISIIVTVLMLTFFIVQLQLRRIIKQKKILEQKVKHRTKKIEDQNIILEKQASELIESNQKLERRQIQIEHQKEELENKNNEISEQRDELILLNNKVKEVNQQQLRFFTNISHEFRTPLTLILSPIERLLSLFQNNEEANSMLRIVNRNANRLLILINQLLEIRKIESGNRDLQVELTETKPYLIDIFNSFNDLALKNNINYQHQINSNKVVWIDKEKLENVLYNLLSNAFKFTPVGKSISLEARSIIDKGNEFLKISIIDAGIGIPDTKIEKLFDRFYQVTDEKNHKNTGTGIGLSMVKSLIEIMHGTIKVESSKEGSTFTINIPTNKQKFADHEIDTTGQIYESEIKNKVSILYDQLNEEKTISTINIEQEIETILVIEDNNDMRSFICSNFSKYFKVLDAENGRIGYEMAKQYEPALIISDIMMPEINGLELCKKLKNNLYTSHIPVVLLTAKGNTKDFLEGLERGADDYIAKPFNIDILIAKVNGLIENRKKLKSRFSSLEDVNPEDLTSSGLDDQFFNKINQVVEKFYTDAAFNVDHFAAEMFVSRSQLYKKLKAITNLSANDFINVYRLKKSVELLKKGNLQISEIAYSVGFNDPKYYSRVFRKFFKYSPSEYLNKMKQID